MFPRPLSRRPPLAWAVLALAALTACGGPAEPEPSQGRAPALLPEVIDERPKVLALGDSLTAGYGLLEVEAYPAVLQQFIDREGYEFEVVNGGLSGDTSSGALSRLDWLLTDDVAVIIVALGGNDGLRGLPVEQMRSNLTQIIERAQARGIMIVLAGMEAPPNFGAEYSAAFRRVFSELARQYRVTYIPFLLEGVAGVSNLNQGDGIHPNAEGTRRVAEIVWTALQPVLDLLAQ